MTRIPRATILSLLGSPRISSSREATTSWMMPYGEKIGWISGGENGDGYFGPNVACLLLARIPHMRVPGLTL